MHQHAHTWCILKTLYSGSGGSGTSALVPSAKSGSVGSGGGLSTNPDTPPGEAADRLDVLLVRSFCALCARRDIRPGAI